MKRCEPSRAADNGSQRLEAAADGPRRWRARRHGGRTEDGGDGGWTAATRVRSEASGGGSGRHDGRVAGDDAGAAAQADGSGGGASAHRGRDASGDGYRHSRTSGARRMEKGECIGVGRVSRGEGGERGQGCGAWGGGRNARGSARGSDEARARAECMPPSGPARRSGVRQNDREGEVRKPTVWQTDGGARAAEVTAAYG